MSVAGPAWSAQHARGTPGELHDLDLLGAPGRQVWVLEATSAAVVLGSTQRPAAGEVPDGVAVRRSGGGAVWVAPDDTVWIDVVIPRGDPLWVDDVSLSARWLGQAWQAALAGLGVAARVHSGPADRDPVARAACFAGFAAGEVVASGSPTKLVGISQRRTRGGARLQTVAYTSPPDHGAVADAVGPGVAGGPAVVREVLAARTGVVARDPGVLGAAVVDAIMAVPGAGVGRGDGPDGIEENR